MLSCIIDFQFIILISGIILFTSCFAVKINSQNIKKFDSDDEDFIEILVMKYPESEHHLNIENDQSEREIYNII